MARAAASAGNMAAPAAPRVVVRNNVRRDIPADDICKAFSSPKPAPPRCKANWNYSVYLLTIL